MDKSKGKAQYWWASCTNRNAGACMELVEPQFVKVTKGICSGKDAPRNNGSKFQTPISQGAFGLSQHDLLL